MPRVSETFAPPFVDEGDSASQSNGRNGVTFACKLIATLWLAAVVAGVALLGIHAARPGRQAPAPLRWPDASRLAPPSGKATLLVFAHPYCPCTRATLGELAEIMTACHDRVRAQVLFVLPDGMPANGELSDLWRTAAAIPGVHVAVDADGAEAARFGARTSGHTVLFDERGARLFAGGITAARGHAGDNDGRQAITSWLNGGRSETTCAPTFGCPLFDKEPAPPQKDVL